MKSTSKNQGVSIVLFMVLKPFSARPSDTLLDLSLCRDMSTNYYVISLKDEVPSPETVKVIVEPV